MRWPIAALPLLPLLLLLLLGGAAHAQWRLAVKGGAAVFFGSQSSAIEHLIKPVVRLEASAKLGDRLRLGAEVGAVADGTEQYQLLSVAAIVHLDFIATDDVLFGFVAAAGVAPQVPIVQAELRTDGGLAPYGSLGLGISGRVAGPVWLGAEAIVQQLNVASLALTAAVQL